jgi:hypothetical protein
LPAIFAFSSRLGKPPAGRRRHGTYRTTHESSPIKG